MKHTIILFDTFVWNGKFLSTETLRERKSILGDLFDEQRFSDLRNSEMYPTDFRKVYDEYTVGAPERPADMSERMPNREIEGLVMKKMSSKLQVGFSDSPVVSWMWKVRKPTKNYRF
jgi:ATP-dependent DNA ligase